MTTPGGYGIAGQGKFTAFSNITAATQTTLVPALAGKKVRVYGGHANAIAAGAAVSVYEWDGTNDVVDGTDKFLYGTWPAGQVSPLQFLGGYETAVGKGVRASGPMRGGLWWEYVDP